MEEWKVIEDFPEYEVSNQGRVRSLKTERLLTPKLQSKGYLRVNLYKEKKAYSHLVHRLVAKAFLNSDDKIEIDHIDKNKENNHLTNLRWATRAEQNINRDYNNQSGHRHIRKHGNRWVFSLWRNSQMTFRKSYPTLEEAIQARDAFLTSLDQSYTAE